jgi:cytochrome b subunit of formate dehydrogenase
MAVRALSRVPRRLPFLAFLVAIVLLGAGAVRARQVTVDVHPDRIFRDTNCLECHGDKVDVAKFAASVHGANGCTSCHDDIIDVEKHAAGTYKPQPVHCTPCHRTEGKEFEGSIHKVDLGFGCTECHSEPHALAKWDRGKISIIEKCTQCHPKEDYVASGHEAAILRGNQDSAVCSDCHGLHDTRRLHASLNRYPEEARVFYNRTCRRCHGDKEMMKRNNLTTIAVDTYEETYHGKIQRLGYATHVAGCADCHTSHNILPPTDPRSTIHPANRIKNCGRCHPRANANFVRYQPHADFTDRIKYPLLYWTRFFMIGLLVGTFLFFWIHTVLWWRKTYWENHRLRAEGHLIRPELLDLPDAGAYYIRFAIPARMMHVVLILVFFGLVVTGIPLKFSGAPWAQFVMRFLGGAPAAGFIHRMMAGVLIGLFSAALVLSVRFLTRKRYGATFLDRLFSPDSLFFRRKDWEDFKGMARWFVGTGPMPRFDRWTYWEKFDFLAVFWGMMAIGLSGVILWAPDFTAKFLPGWVFNVAILIHSDEAMLAAGFIFTVHFFNTHFIPTKFPMDTVIFTGRMQKYKFLEEKPLHFERLLASGRLEKAKGETPDILTSLLSGIFGLIFLSMGIVSVLLIVIGLLH